MRYSELTRRIDGAGGGAVGHVRLSFAIDDAKLQRACERIASFVAALPVPAV